MSPIVAAVAACVPIGAVCGYITVLRRRLSAALFDATHDPLTGLGNRRLLLPALAAGIDAGRPVAVLVLDVDRFKTVNDRFGHAAGDAVLVALAHRLCTVEVACLLRLGGDEFAAVIDGGYERAVAVADTIWRRVAAEAFTLPDGQPITVRVSVGVAAHRLGLDPAGLLRQADAALARAKTTGTVSGWQPDTPPAASRPRRHPCDRRGASPPAAPDQGQAWRCWFDAGEVMPLADHATSTRHHMRTDGEDDLIQDCPGGLAIRADSGQVTAASTGWPPPLCDPYDPDRVRVAHATDTDPPPQPEAAGVPVVAHVHLDTPAVEAIHKAADWGGLLEITIRGEHASFTLTRP